MSNGVMSIGDAATRSGVPPKTIRYYEEIGLIAPAERLENHYRAYSETDIQTLRFIQRARSLGFPLKEVGELLALYRDRRRHARNFNFRRAAHGSSDIFGNFAHPLRHQLEHIGFVVPHRAFEVGKLRDDVVRFTRVNVRD